MTHIAAAIAATRLLAADLRSARRHVADLAAAVHAIAPRLPAPMRAGHVQRTLATWEAVLAGWLEVLAVWDEGLTVGVQ